MKTYINPADCPFQPNDRVQCNHTHDEGTVLKIDEDVVWVMSDGGKKFYRHWVHDLDTVMHKSGGELTRIARPKGISNG